MRFLITITLLTLSFNAFTQSLWGVNSGGEKGAGVLYQLDANGNHIDSYPFEYFQGGYPTGSLTQDPLTGKLYGMTSAGRGLIFEYTPTTNTYSVIYNINYSNSNAQSSLILVNGSLYGMTLNGGANNGGTIFEYNLSTNTFTKKIDLSTSTGINPYGCLLLANNGKLYGMTSAGGSSYKGVIFEYNIATNTYTKKIDFNGANGSTPYGSLIQASNGKLYGMTSSGGNNNVGVIFEYDITTNAYTKKIDFRSTASNTPYGTLIQASNGKLYGSATGLFEYNFNTNAITTKAYLFGNSYGSLVEAYGKLYGMTIQGGDSIKGAIYEYDLSTDVYTKIFDFNGTNGESPFGSLMVYWNISGPTLYGVTKNGGERNAGVLFEYDLNSYNYKKILDFGYAPYGSEPQPYVTFGPNGKLYGTTQSGGSNNRGVIFEFDTLSHTFSKKFDFSDLNGSGANGLTLASNGKFYGTTKTGGINTQGTMFVYDPITGTFTKLRDFYNGASNYPTTLTQAANGKLYGVGGGGLFEYDILNDLLIIKPNTTNGIGIPLINGNNGKLYSQGASSIAEYDPATNIIRSFSFPLAQNHKMNGIMLAYNGKFYGTLYNGGINDFGILYEFNPNTNTFSKLIDFNALNGKYPLGSLIQSSNGKLYGLTKESGQSNPGLIYEFDYNSNVITTKYLFNTYSGNPPLSDETRLTKGQSPLISRTITVSANPSNGGTVSGGGIYNDGATVALNASANTGFTFTGWTENASPVSTNSNYTFTANTDRNLIANFTSITTGINNSSNENSIIRAYPNPARDQIIIDYRNLNTSGYTLSIINSTGQLIYKTPVDQQKSIIDLSTIKADGVYYIQLIDSKNNIIEIHKIVIK